MKLDGNNNKNKLYIIIIVGLLFLFVVGISFAYFQTQYGNGGKVDLKAKTYSVDELSFNIGEDITLNPNQFNFAQGKGNLEGVTNAAAILKANNKTNLAKMNYYAYVVVTKNEFKYTTSDKKAELVLSVEGPNGVVTTLPDLGNAIDVTDNAGNTFKAFDITEFSGVITLADNKEIEVASSDNGKKQEDWKIKVTFINLDADQSNNSDKSFSANMMIQKEKFAGTMADICKGQLLTDCVSAQYYVLKNHNGLYYHDGTITDSNSNVIDAGDNSYRYAGANPNNYICFGSDEETCPDDNLYRIIGVFGDNNHGIKGQQLVKVIKNTTYGKLAWNTSNSNDWASALLNSTLNTTFKTEKLSGFEDKIAEVTWRVSGFNNESVPVKTLYTAEITNATKTHTAKIGLMYPSDYGFATMQDYWATSLNEYYHTAAYRKDWLFLGSDEWLLSPRSSHSTIAWYVVSTGNPVCDSAGYVINAYAVRPSFYLLSSVNYVSGDGSINSPFRIN